MPLKPRPPNFDDFIRRYEAGEPYPKLSQELGVAFGTFRRWLVESNVHVRSRSEGLRLGWEQRDRPVIDTDTAMAALEAGESMKALAARLGVNRQVLTERLRSVGYDPRGRSDALRLRWQQIDDPAALLQGAWDAARGRVQPEAERLVHAQARHGHRSSIGRHEQALTDALRARGLSVTQQRPVGPYNIDVAVDEPPIAVEVYTSSPKATRPGRRATHMERVEYLLNEGWIVLHVNCRTYVEIGGLAEYVVALAQRASRDESMRGRYGVVRGDGERPTRTSPKFNHLPRIPGT